MAEKNIYSALTAIIGEVGAIGKNQKNQQQGFVFRGIDDVMNELHTLFGKYKVIIVPEVVDYNVNEKTTSRGTAMYVTRSTIKFHFVADDGSEVVTTNVGEAMDSADKGMNKTMSCALKYALMQMFLIPTKDIEDPDRVTPPDTQPTAPVPDLPDPDTLLVLDQVKQCKSVEELQKLWNELSGWQSNKVFIAEVNKRKKELSK